MKKVIFLFPSESPVKIEILSNPPFLKNLVESSTHQAEMGRERMQTMLR